MGNTVRIENDLYRLNANQPNAGIVLGMLSLGLLFNVGVLFYHAYHHPKTRMIAILIGASILSSFLLTPLLLQFPVIGRLGSLAQVLPAMLILGYAVVGTRLFAPTRTALDRALLSMSEAVAVIDERGSVVYANPPAEQIGVKIDEPLNEQLNTIASGIAMLVDLGVEELGVSQTIEIDGRQIEVTLSPVRDASNTPRGTLLLGRDVTEIEERNRQIDRERARLAEAVMQLENEKIERAQMVITMRQISLPVIPVLPGVLVLPLIGDFDSNRIEEFIAVLLQGIERENAHTALLDITGVSLLDTAGTQGLILGVRSAKMLGAECVLVGVRPEIAQSLVALGVELSELATVQNLQTAVLSQVRRMAIAKRG